MAIPLTLTSLAVVGISYPTQGVVTVNYVLGYQDGAGMQHVVTIDGEPAQLTLMASTGNDPLPSPPELTTLLAGDARTKYGASPDTITYNGIDYPITPPV